MTDNNRRRNVILWQHLSAVLVIAAIAIPLGWITGQWWIAALQFTLTVWVITLQIMRLHMLER